jgi:glyoxylase-like metal-dependent hydrolase (beta-lactamase superfamily II)
MRHARIIVAVSVVVAAIAAPVATRQQPQGDPFSTEIRKVKDGLYVIPGYDGAVTGGNVAVRVTSEGVVIVDDRLPPSSGEIVGKVRSVTPQPIRYVFSSHNHGDHTGGHSEFIKIAEIIAHRNNRANMIRGKQASPPRIAFSDQASVFLGGVEVQAIHLGRGHTDGDAVTYFPDLRTVHTGDLVVWGQRTDKTQLTPYVDRRNGGSLNEWVGTVEKLLQLDFDTAIPGHGPILTKDQVRTYHRSLITLRQRLTELVRLGGTRNDLGTRLKTDDLNWPFPPERLDELWNEFGPPPSR